MELARVAGVVARGREQGTQFLPPVLGVDLLPVLLDAHGRRKPPGQQARPRGGVDGVLRVTALEPDPVGRDPVDVRRPAGGVGGDGVRALLVGQQDEDVRLIGYGAGEENPGEKRLLQAGSDPPARATAGN